jgi:hypothetical protein
MPTPVAREIVAAIVVAPIEAARGREPKILGRELADDVAPLDQRTRLIHRETYHGRAVEDAGPCRHRTVGPHHVVELPRNANGVTGRKPMHEQRRLECDDRVPGSQRFLHLWGKASWGSLRGSHDARSVSVDRNDPGAAAPSLASPMALSIGIVGLPNVGKSTLFNALTVNDVLAANYPLRDDRAQRGGRRGP